MTHFAVAEPEVACVLSRRKPSSQKRLRDLQGGKQGAAPVDAKGAETFVAYPLRPIGTLHSVFSQRNGTPRQPLLVPLARARLKLRLATHASYVLAGVCPCV